jgi:acyl-coenzyme A synthetase/AMP-(fatty) acid ligase
VGTLTLSQLFQGARSPDHPVALAQAPGGFQVRTWSQFAASAAWAADRVRRNGGQRWLLASPDAWDFAAGLAALLLAGRTVVLAPNFLPLTLEALEREADGALGTCGSLPGAPPPDPVPGGRVEFWTAGSTGEPRGIPRTLAQLEAEAAVLERHFAHLLPDGPVVGTVPHHHIYGCLFRILWPLAAGRPFLCEPAGDPDCFRQALAHPRPVILVASPAHLSRLPALVDLDRVPTPPGAVFSSGGPLGRREALEWRRWVPGGVVEIYGSTETGGIAWRNQGPAPESGDWTPLDDVALAFREDGLVVDSFRAGPEPRRLEDRAEPTADGRFRLAGRLDRILKLEEKRVSLPELERALEGVPWVVRAAVVPLPGTRPILGAVVVLGAGAPAGRAVLARALRDHLAQRFDGPALPRRWRFPRELPYDDRGKLTVQALAGLFQAAQGGASRP